MSKTNQSDSKSDSTADNHLFVVGSIFDRTSFTHKGYIAKLTMEGDLAVIDYEKCINCGLCAEKCPTDTITFEGKKVKNIEITDDCVGCTLCAKACPVDAIEGEPKEKHEIDPEKCVKCGICYDTCNVDAIKVEYE